MNQCCKLLKQWIMKRLSVNFESPPTVRSRMCFWNAVLALALAGLLGGSALIFAINTDVYTYQQLFKAFKPEPRFLLSGMALAVPCFVLSESLWISLSLFFRESETIGHHVRTRSKGGFIAVLFCIGLTDAIVRVPILALGGIWWAAAINFLCNALVMGVNARTLAPLLVNFAMSIVWSSMYLYAGNIWVTIMAIAGSSAIAQLVRMRIRAQN